MRTEVFRPKIVGVTVYPEKIVCRLRAPRHVGLFANANATGAAASFECGSFVRFDLAIDPASKFIHSVVFKTNGCGFAVAAADVLAESVRSRALTEGLDSDFFSAAITRELGEFGNSRKHCAELAVNSLRVALGEFRQQTVREFAGEKALICTCFGVSEETIEKLIRDRRATTLDEIGERCNAGTGCGSCRLLITEMLDHQHDSF